jgi:hypothetical protein
MLPIVAAVPAAVNDRRDKWPDLLSFGIVVLPVSSTVVPGITSARTFLTQNRKSFAIGLARYC